MVEVMVGTPSDDSTEIFQSRKKYANSLARRSTETTFSKMDFKSNPNLFFHTEESKRIIPRRTYSSPTLYTLSFNFPSLTQCTNKHHPIPCQGPASSAFVIDNRTYVRGWASAFIPVPSRISFWLPHVAWDCCVRDATCYGLSGELSVPGIQAQCDFS